MWIFLLLLNTASAAMLEELLYRKRRRHWRVEGLRVGVVVPGYAKLDLLSKQAHHEDIVLLGGSNFSELPNVVHTLRGKSLTGGYDWLYDNGYDILCNLDPDVFVKPNWLSESVNLVQMYPDSIISAFNSKNLDCVNKTFATHYFKSCGVGIHYCFTRNTYIEIRPVLKEDGNALEEHMRSIGLFFVSTKPSLIQHVGFDADFAPDYILSEEEIDLIRHIPQLDVLWN
jgi:hypothetical protein